jgi:hypothetical protein
MAADNHNSWVEYDVAIAVIGKMIAEYNQRRNSLLDEYDHAGFDERDEEVQSDKNYIQLTNRILELRNEINMIYKGQNLETLLAKIKNEYGPFLREKYGVSQALAVIQ